MNKLNFPDQLLLRHTINTCIYYGKTYHWQSRETQRAGILKRFGVEISVPTFDRAIRRTKDRWGLMKQHRTGNVKGVGCKWTSAITGMSWMLVMLMYRLGEVSYEQFKRLKEIFGLVKKRGPAKLQAPPASKQDRRERSGNEPSLSPP